MPVSRNNHYQHLGTKVQSTDIVQLPLLPDHQKELAGIVANPEQLWDDLETLVSQGYSVTFSPNEQSGGFSCCIRGMYTQNPNAGKALYCNAPSVITTMLVGVFKCFGIAGNGEWDASATRQETPFS